MHDREQVIEINGGNDYVTALVQAIACEIERTLGVNGHACLAVSRDRSSVPVFAALRQQQLGWDRVRVILADERMVPLNHADSNASSVCDILLRNAAAKAEFLPPVPPYCFEIDEIHTSAVVAELNRSYRQPDIVMLGMGEDGHIASLFADAPELKAALSAEKDPGYLSLSPRAAPHRRVSLNLSALLGARRIILGFSGVWKKQVFDAAALELTPVLPVSYLLHQNRTPVDVYWEK
ncbi:6-phosphogluconolactonase [Cupriavidus nantongensis]|uniref:6-phosphogluconolactonase n=1 Tax=Cupriavidus nantongensis TaxID=1796606 RepID=UPI000AC49237|nr:6-phosphogluconolactonase [Cupriavidus nantongensis]